jgi:hypothetical protein
VNLPDIPYDNLYKFLAVVGVLVFAVSVIFPTYASVYLEDMYASELAEKIKLDLRYQSIEDEYDETSLEMNMVILSLQSKLENISEENTKTLSVFFEFENKTLNRYEFLIEMRLLILTKLSESDCFVVNFNESYYRIEPIADCIENSVNEIDTILYNSLGRITADLKSLEKDYISEKGDFESKANTQFRDFNKTYAAFVDKKSLYNDEKEEILNFAKEFMINDYVETYFYFQIYKNRISMIQRYKFFSYVISTFGFLLALFGFYQWYHKSQKIIDESLKIDMELKKIRLKRVKEKYN